MQENFQEIPMRRFFLKLIAILPLLAADIAFAQSEQPISLESYCEISKRLYALSELELKASSGVTARRTKPA